MIDALGVKRLFWRLVVEHSRCWLLEVKSTGVRFVSGAILALTKFGTISGSRMASRISEITAAPLCRLDLVSFSSTIMTLKLYYFLAMQHLVHALSKDTLEPYDCLVQTSAPKTAT